MTVMIISTGGTIASTSTQSTDNVSPSLTGNDLVEEVPALRDVASIETYDFSNVPSPHFSVEQMLSLSKLIQTFDNDSKIDGIVVTQGTDILEESAYFVDLCYDGSTPVAFTGAMRNPDLPSPDGPANLLTSVRATLAAQAEEINVMIVFNDRIHSARGATKTHSMNADTFRTPEFGPIGVRDENRIIWHRSPRNLDQTFSPSESKLTNNVFPVTVTADMQPNHLRPGLNSKALCLAATGAGHIPPKIIPILEEIIEADIPVVATTRCPEGRLAQDTYDYEGSEKTLQKLGCYYSDLNVQKTRIKTIVALAANQIADAFYQPKTD